MAAQLKWDTVRTKYHLYLEELGSNVIIWILWFSRSLNVVNDNMNIGYIKAPIKGVDFFLAGPSFVVKQIAQIFLKQYGSYLAGVQSVWGRSFFTSVHFSKLQVTDKVKINWVQDDICCKVTVLFSVEFLRSSSLQLLYISL